MRKKTHFHPLLISAVVGGFWIARAIIQKLREDDLRGQVALIAGGSRGLGLVLAREFARQGCKIAICARDADELERARTMIAREGVEVLTVLCDVGERQQVAAMIEAVTAHFGQIDILVNNAAMIQVGPVEAMSLKDMEDAHRIIYWGTVYPTLGTLPQMMQRGYGRIVNIASIGGKVSVPHMLPYSAAKFAVVGFSEGLRAEMASKGISVTTIAPGLTRTGSYLNVAYKGHHAEEFTWFSMMNNSPLTSISAEQAARQTVQATKRGDAERILSIQASAAARFHGLFPGAAIRFMTLFNHFLPSARGAGRTTARGLDIVGSSESPKVKRLAVNGRKAAERYNELPPEQVAHDSDIQAEYHH